MIFPKIGEGGHALRVCGWPKLSKSWSYKKKGGLMTKKKTVEGELGPI
jgi:hypothetical protein